MLSGAQTIGQKEGIAYEPQSTHDQRIRWQERRNQTPLKRTAVVEFSVATKKSWKDANEEWKNKTQWHTIIDFGVRFAQMAERLIKGAHVFVQGELTTREYGRVIQVPNGKKTIEYTVRQLVVELRADTIRILDQSSNLGFAC